MLMAETNGKSNQKGQGGSTFVAVLTLLVIAAVLPAFTRILIEIMVWSWNLPLELSFG